MRHGFALVALVTGLALSAGGATWPAEPAPTGSPRLVVDQPVVDLGDVVRGQEATAVFELENAGDAVLQILNAKPG